MKTRIPTIVILGFAIVFSLLHSAGRSSSGPPLTFDETGWTEHGAWKAWGSISRSLWEPGNLLSIDATVEVTDDHLAQLARDHKITADSLLILITAERTFDAEGRFRQVNDEKTSTLLTPTGLAIEGGIQGAATNRFGYDWKTPLDLFKSIRLAETKKTEAGRQARFQFAAALPQDLPPGVYRLRFDVGVAQGTRYFSLNCDTFSQRPFFTGRAPESHWYSAPIPANGTAASGQYVDAVSLPRRLPWVLLGDYNSNGYRGVVADEDKLHFALSPRNLIPDEVILPLFDDGGKPLAYTLEPRFPTETIEARSNIPWNYAGGELRAALTQPDGRVVNIGPYPFIGKKGSWPTTGKSALTGWKPPMYGLYQIRLTGWINDIWGNRVEGGGTYRFWIAKRMTLATATFQGMAYPVGNRYGRDLGFAPAVPADVEVEAVLYVNSDPNDKITVSYKGKATPGGIFGSAQGAVPLPLTAPGEYCGRILATYTDRDGHLWVASMRHAGVVYPAETTIVARGKKLKIGANYVDRGETRFEGYSNSDTDKALVHINFPFVSGDVLQMASEQQGANKIEPVLTYEDLAKPFPYDPSKYAALGASNIKLRTSNGLSPHMFPEYITDRAYYYGGAPRPGFMSRFIVGENGVRAPYWPLSPNSFGGQINTSNNGDLPGDIYRLIGGVVLRPAAEAPRYAGYLSSAFILPKGTNNNRVHSAGAEDVIGSTGEKARFFLVGLRPGMVYEQGAVFTAVAQIDPVLPALVRYTLRYPDGRTVSTEGAGDAWGSFAAKDRWTLDQAGLYRYWITGEWNGNQGVMPGFPTNGGEFYVLEKVRPEGAEGIRLNLPNQSSFNPAQILTISGTTTAAEVRFAAVIPGCIIDQGLLLPKNGRFEYRFDPAAVNRKAPTYDIINLVNGKTELGRVVQLTFFAKEKTLQGQTYHDFVRLILRGSRVFYAR
jgi:hypothetical protein